MRIGDFDLNERPFVVAEIGNNHEGDFDLAVHLIDLAARAGADGVKFQTFNPSEVVSSEDPTRLKQLTRFALTIEQFKVLAGHAERAGILFLSTPLDLASARALNPFVPGFKIASGDNTLLPLLDLLTDLHKPLILSTGFVDLATIQRIHDRIVARWAAQGVSPGLALLHCVSSYPVPEEQANLAAISTLKRHFPSAVVGYSDHTMGIDAAIYAVAAGARIVEKHFTVDKNHSDFRDHGLSADYDDMIALVEAIRSVTRLMGSGEKTPQSCEQAIVRACRRSAAAAVDLAADATVTRARLMWVRPGTGVACENEQSILGRRLRHSLSRGQLIHEENLY